MAEVLVNLRDADAVISFPQNGAIEKFLNYASSPAAAKLADVKIVAPKDSRAYRCHRDYIQMKNLHLTKSLRFHFDSETCLKSPINIKLFFLGVGNPKPKLKLFFKNSSQIFSVESGATGSSSRRRASSSQSSWVTTGTRSPSSSPRSTRSWSRRRTITVCFNLP